MAFNGEGLPGEGLPGEGLPGEGLPGVKRRVREEEGGVGHPSMSFHSSPMLDPFPMSPCHCHRGPSVPASALRATVSLF